MKTKLTSVLYLGYTAMDRRFSNAMLPWLLREIQSTGIIRDKLSIAIEDGSLKAYNGNFEPVFVHRLVDIIRASHVPGKPEELFYILHNEKEGLLNCYLFRASTAREVSELFGQMREASPSTASPKGSTSSLTSGSVTKNIGFQQQNSSEHLPWSGSAVPLAGNWNSNLTNDTQSSLVRTSSNASTLTSLCADLSPSDSHFFEVLYIGKVRISQRKVPDSLIDDALSKFAHHEAEKVKNQRRHSLLTTTGPSIYSESCESLNDNKKTDSSFVANDKTKKNNITTSTTPLEPDKGYPWKSENNLTREYINEQTDKVNEPKDVIEVEQEFDKFTKERVEKECTIRKPTPTPLEPSVLILNIHQKNNLCTLNEDEEKVDEIQSIISQTASSITKFCTDKIIEHDMTNDIKISKEQKSSEAFEEKTHRTIDSRSGLEFLYKSISENSNVNQEENKENISARENNPAPNVNFQEYNKPKTLFESKTGSQNGMKESSMPENKPFLRDRSASIGTLNVKTPITQLIGEPNRTMLFQVARSELRLISPDRKQILLHRAFKDVASCVLGQQNRDHFGFVCRESSEAYACYVFKCESDSVALEVVHAIRQAFIAHAELLKKSREKSPNMTCEHCPILWYHRLCHDAEGMNEKKIHAFILRRIEQLPVDEQDLIITKYQGGTNHTYETSEHNAFLMMLLRAHCEAKQQRHIHDTAENRSEFLNQYLGGSTIFMKAKRSLSSGFDHLLKRRTSRDEGPLIRKETSPNTPQIKNASVVAPSLGDSTSTEQSVNDLLAPDSDRGKSISPVQSSNENGSHSPRGVDTVHTSDESDSAKEDSTTPTNNSAIMNIFLKVGDNRPAVTEASDDHEATWRQAIYEKIVQPTDINGDAELAPNNLLGLPPLMHEGRRSKEQLRRLWQMAIDQTILLVRMERENARLKESEESSAVRRIKLEYIDLGSCDAGVTHMWDSLLSRDPSQPVAKVDRHMLTQAVMQGVPRMSRGAVWYFLAEQACLRSPPPDVKQCPLYHTPYHTLISGLTKHQHAILIDLGRTFPQHSYFASALGPGQLALYNILKAYSLLDPDVGYCQGLSFVAGVLLLHMDEAEAFILLRHLMFRRGLRKQYLPDMSALQVQMYQLSRLLRDHEPELHAKLESLDISPALYAAPWMLTLFTSQFPLGFVVRIFDLIFLDSLDIVFSVSLALLSAHRDGLMLCESCEEAAEYLKHKLPDVDKVIYNQVMKKVRSLDISRQLADYAIEYGVLREEMPRLSSLTEENKRLVADNRKMSEELDSAMEAITNYQNTQKTLEIQNKTLEQKITLLSRYISAHHKQDMPLEIKKIIQNYSKKLSFSSKISFKFTSNDEEENDKRKNFKTGVSAPNLFAKVSRDDVIKATDNMEIERSSVSPENDRKRFLMKKSQSVQSGLVANIKHLPLKVLEENIEDNCKSDSFKTEIITEPLRELSRKNSGYFCITNERITQEQMFAKQVKRDFDENLKKLDEKINTAFGDNVNILQSKRSMSLNLINTKLENKTTDSGFVTPMSPNNSDDKGDKDDLISVVSHPLSDCDVDIKFDGQSTKLKQIRSSKNNVAK